MCAFLVVLEPSFNNTTTLTKRKEEIKEDEREMPQESAVASPPAREEDGDEDAVYSEGECEPGEEDLFGAKGPPARESASTLRKLRAGPGDHKLGEADRLKGTATGPGARMPSLVRWSGDRARSMFVRSSPYRGWRKKRLNLV